MNASLAGHAGTTVVGSDIVGSEEGFSEGATAGVITFIFDEKKLQFCKLCSILPIYEVSKNWKFSLLLFSLETCGWLCQQEIFPPTYRKETRVFIEIE